MAKRAKRPKRDPAEVQHEVNDTAARLLKSFRLDSGLIKRTYRGKIEGGDAEGDYVDEPFKLHKLDSIKLRTIAHAARQIADIGRSAQALLARRSIESRRNHIQHLDDRRFAAIRHESQALRDRGLGRDQRLMQLHSMPNLIDVMEPVRESHKYIIWR